jgi:hypothetical protein
MSALRFCKHLDKVKIKDELRSQVLCENCVVVYEMGRQDLINYIEDHVLVNEPYSQEFCERLRREINNNISFLPPSVS